MADFVFLYRSSPDVNWAATPEQRQQGLQRWREWMSGIEATGQLKDNGQPLDAAGKVVRNNGALITDGPFAEAKDLVGGFSIVTAATLAEAAELAKGCPVLMMPGGAVEVRPIMRMDF